mmetsp:Transcript_30760/g.56813  ORF Transcript_30760/g.56813 Transcript_30760/m.56813 type:complete len:171 (-) Transcript_30760:80-592(-)
MARLRRTRKGITGPCVLFLAAVAVFRSLRDWDRNRDGAWPLGQAFSLSKAAGAVLAAALPEPVRERKPHLVGFYAEQNMEAKRMKYLGELLEQELPGTRIIWLETWENALNERLRGAIDLRNQCGGVPYLFNRKTGKVLCGVQPYDKLRRWAQGFGGDARIYRDVGSDSY